MNRTLGIFIIFLIIVSGITAINGNNMVEFEEADYFFNPPMSSDAYYFSLINKRYTWDIYKKYMYDGLLEVVKFVNLKLEIFKEEFTYGSHVIHRDDIKATIDAEIAVEIGSYVKPIKLYKTKQGDILVLKVTRSNMQSIWKKYNKSSLPTYNFDVSDEISNGYPGWFLKPPQFDGYITGVGYFASSTSAQVNFKEADYMARIEVIKTMKLLIKSDQEMFAQENFELYTFFNEFGASAHLGGILIIKRYYDKKTNAAFSLAVLKM